MKSLVLVSQSPLVRQRMQDIVGPIDGLRVVAIGNVGKAFDQVILRRADMVLIDASFGYTRGIRSLMVQLRSLERQPLVVLLADRNGDQYLYSVADFVVFLDFDTAAIGRALQLLTVGVVAIPPRIRASGGDDGGSPYRYRHLASLTRRELEILGLLADGRSNREISRQLSISGETVKEHVSGILRKLEVTSRIQAAVIAVRAGIL